MRLTQLFDNWKDELTEQIKDMVTGIFASVRGCGSNVASSRTLTPLVGHDDVEKDGHDSFSRPFDPNEEEADEGTNVSESPFKEKGLNNAHNQITHFPFDPKCEIC